MKSFVLGIGLLFAIIGNSQKKYPTEYFQSPMNIPIILAGTFGELRSNHFHSGIDIKTQQREGLPIFAIADGAVTRIKVSLWGYGKVLYVTHPNGYTSVYGHLQKFSPKIEAYVQKLQYAKKSFEIETFPNSDALILEKGEIIAYSGNTGGSSGPHLHFEIRENGTQKPTNPLLYGYEVPDATNPILEKVFLYPLNENSAVNGNTTRTQLNFTTQADGSFITDKVTANGVLGLGFIGFDRLDMAANRNGIYAITMKVNGTVVTSYNFDAFSFKETRYINTLIDYEYQSLFRERILKCFKSPGNKLSIYNTALDDGKININNGLSYTLELLLEDIAGNETKLTIPIVGKELPAQEVVTEKTYLNYLVANKPNNYDLEAAKVYFPTNTFYEDFYIDLKKGKDTIAIHNNTVPAHRKFTISFDVKKYTKKERKQLFIVRLNQKLKSYYVSTYKRANTFTTRTKNLGTYTLAKDSVAPKITTKNFKEEQNLDAYKFLSLTITDDFSGIATYNATINGTWVLMEYEPKKKTITYTFNEKLEKAKIYNLNVRVTDNVGNETILETSFTRK